MTPLRSLNKLSLSFIQIPFKSFIEYMKNSHNLTELRLHNVKLHLDDETDFYEDFKEAMKNVVTFEIRHSFSIKIQNQRESK
jgi:hypothetical protein